ncbi:MAG TPA: RraA family protein [Stellaceae bacterium]|nr:RraA family protein [Stellaceae bacterium]
MTTPTQRDLAALAEFDTPTICNALEVVAPERRALGFNRRPLVCPFPSMKPVVAYARTATIRSREPHPKTGAEMRALRLAYYDYIGQAPLPSIAVIQDIDGADAGFGAFWGEVQTNVHKALGCIGTITDGSVRDIDQMAPGFFVLAGSIMPSHAHVHSVDFGGTVSVAGMVVSSNDLIHADRHGAVVIPHAVVTRIPEAASLIARREKVLLDAAKQPGFGMAQLREAFARMDDIH